jgi:hypothetical protein
MKRYRVRMLLGVLTAALTTSGEGLPERPPPRVPDRVTLDQRVAGATFIFVGEGRRIYFVNCRYEEVPYEQAAALDTSRMAFIEIEVSTPLLPRKWTEGNKVIIPITTSAERQASGRIPYNELASRHVGRQGIYFTTRTVLHSEVSSCGSPNTPIKLGTPIDAHRLSTLPALEGPKENPLPLDYLDEVQAIINRREN